VKQRGKSRAPQDWDKGLYSGRTKAAVRPGDTKNVGLKKAKASIFCWWREDRVFERRGPYQKSKSVIMGEEQRIGLL